MTHILDNRLAIDVDNDHETGWPNGLNRLASILIDGQPLTVAFFDPHLRRADGSSIVTKKTLDDWKNLGRIPGLRFGPNWYGTPEPGFCAKVFSDEIGRFENDGVRRVQVVEYDVELPHNDPQQTAQMLEWQVRFLLGYVRGDGVRVKGIRGCGGDYPDQKRPVTLGYRWGRPFVFTFEGRQTTGICAGDVAARAGGKVGPQPYNGPMTEVWDDKREFDYWVRGGRVPAALFTLYRDAAALHRPRGMLEAILFATSRLTELYQ